MNMPCACMTKCRLRPLSIVLLHWIDHPLHTTGPLPYSVPFLQSCLIYVCFGFIPDCYVCPFLFPLTLYSSTSPSNTCSLSQVVISVLPVNDNPPVFENETYTISIRENTAIGTTFVLVLATDADIGGQHGVVMYSSSITGECVCVFACVRTVETQDFIECTHHCKLHRKVMLTNRAVT